ncbi:MAG: phosphoribosylanthranilate isomerase [Oscillospiraceae bacterium]|nr:phosphoribosylanthranilate isomerase [Oscillospiraceae bacterium]
MTRIKICGLSRPEDVEAVNAARPDYCGFVVNFPKSRRNVSPEQAARLRRLLDDGITAVGVFVDQPPEVAAAMMNGGVIDIAQLHGHENESYFSRLRELTNGKPIWKAFKIRATADIEAARRSSADFVLLDNGAGTGVAFDWTLIRDMGRPWILAGGLTPENLPEAIRRLRPWCVDISGGVETDGVKDPSRILAAVQAARNAEGGTWDV